MWDADIPGAGIHPVVIATRDSAIDVLSSLICALVTTSFHGHVAEVEVGRDEGLAHESAINCDNLFTLPKAVLTRRRGHLGPTRLAQFDQALAIAVGVQ